MQSSAIRLLESVDEITGTNRNKNNFQSWYSFILTFLSRFVWTTGIFLGSKAMMECSTKLSQKINVNLKN